ncbi:MAG: Mpo1-like protein [Silanimonas sp.]
MSTTTSPRTGFASFREFYPFYLAEHSNRTSRRLHVIGSSGVLLILALVVAQVLSPWWLLALPVCGYGFAWVGHFFFEHNKPATFKHPLYSLMGDWVMFKDVLTGRIPF